MRAGTKLRKPGWSQRRNGRPYQKHGLIAAKRALERGLELDGRTRLGRAMQAARTALVEDFDGGLMGLSPRQRGLVDAAVQLKVLVDSAAAWVFRQETIVNRRKRSLWPIAGELASLLTRYTAVLKDLGLERRAKPLPTLAEYLASKAAPPVPAPPPGDAA